MSQEIPVFNLEGKETGKLTLDEHFFDGRIHSFSVHQAVVATQANRRQGTLGTKTRAYVSGGGKKPWRQKHTGRARAGSNRSPLWRKGGIIFGPHPRDFSLRPSQKVRQLALRSCLNDKAQTGSIRAVEGLDKISAKTKDLVKALSGWGCQGRSLLVVEKPSLELKRASRNLRAVNLVSAASICAEDVIRSTQVVLTPGALKTLVDQGTRASHE